MIISCEKCNKKFEISDELIPDEGRLLRCGSCSYEWHYMPIKRVKSIKEPSIKPEEKKIRKFKTKQNIEKKY